MSLRFKSLGEIPVHLLRRTGMHVEVARIEQPPEPKYRNKAVMVQGKRFDSKLEGRCYQWLNLRWKAGDVAWFVRQVPFELEGGVIYRADFVVVLAKGGIEVIDATGLLTQVKKNKLRQVKERYGLDVVLWSDKQ